MQGCAGLTIGVHFQNKKRKYDRDGDEGRERTPEEPAEDPLKDAATLYVGNLYGVMMPDVKSKLTNVHPTGPSTQLKSRFTSYSQNAGRSRG